MNTISKSDHTNFDFVLTSMKNSQTTALLFFLLSLIPAFAAPAGSKKNDGKKGKILLKSQRGTKRPKVIVRRLFLRGIGDLDENEEPDEEEDDDYYTTLGYLNYKSQVEISHRRFLDAIGTDSEDVTFEKNRLPTNRTAVIYSGPTSMDPNRDKNWLYLKNFEYFLDHGVDCHKHDTYLVLTSETARGFDLRIQALIQKDCRYDVTVIEREDRCYDMESMNMFLKTVNLDWYDYFVYINCGMVGPKTKDEDPYWTEIFTSPLSDTVKMSGLAINLSFHPHVQSFLYALDREGIEIVKDCIYECGKANSDMTDDDRWAIIQRFEIGMGRAIFEAGYSLHAAVGPVGPFSVNQEMIDHVKTVDKDKGSDVKILGSHNSKDMTTIWTEYSTPFALPWGDDIWNPNALRLIGNGSPPSFSDMVFFKASRFYMIPGMEDIGYEKQYLGHFADVKPIKSLSLRSLSDTIDVCEVAKTDFRKASKLFAIVTGMMHSGTSILSQLLMSAPDVYGAAECGLLEAKTPSDFVNIDPFYDWVVGTDAGGHWALDEGSRDKIVNARCDAEMYATLRTYSPLYHYGMNKDSMILDKTPGYMLHLVDVMDRTPGVPIVVTQMTEEDTRKALDKRYSNNPDLMARVLRQIQKNEEQLKLSLAKYPDRIHITNTSRWYEDPDEVLQSTYDFLGIEWKSEYLTMDAVNAKRVPGSVKTVPFTKERNSKISVVYQV